MSESLKRVEAAFDEAVAVPPGAERTAVLARVCGDDKALRSEVETLLKAHDGCGRFLEGEATLKVDAPQAGTPSATALLSDGAVQAAAYVDHPEPRLPLEDYLASVPGALRQEVRERIGAALACRAAVKRVAGPAESEPVPAIPGFQLRRVLGRGGLGTVYEAWDEKLQRTAALKVLRVQLGGDQRPRLLAEARRAAAVHDPAIVTIYSVLDEANPPAIVMELVAGFPLDQFCQNLTFQQKARLLQEVARGLAVAHGQGLIHRDLKPDNVLVGPDMKPKILDFGLAVPADEVQGGLGYFEGSPLYASPEQAAGRPLTAASDIFSFGSMMFKVLTGRPPFPGRNIEEVLRAVATTHPPFLRTVAVGTPEDLQAVCLACLSWNAADRPTATELVAELGRYLAGEPVYLKPRLYDDILRQRVSAHSTEAETWQSQDMISSDERDALAVVHRRVLADEDHWIIDARRLTLVQTALYGGAWLVVVASVLTVWLLRDEQGKPWTPWGWLAPALGTAILLGLGWLAEKRKEALASASFLAAAALSIAPFTLACLERMRLLDKPAMTAIGREVMQLFEGGPFTNQQVLAASFVAFIISALGLLRLKMTGFAWTTAVLGTATYLSVLMQFDWLAKKPQFMALWCLPLAAVEPIALALERAGRARWTMPFHLVSLIAFVGALDVMAANGPTLEMFGATTQRWPWLDHERQQYLSFALNGVMFLILMLMTEHARSLDLRRAAKVLEVLGIAHTLGPLFLNAREHGTTADVLIYLCAALAFVGVAPWRSRWRLMVGGLAGLAFGSYLLVDLDLVAKKPFVVALGLAGLLLAAGTFAWLRRAARARRH